MKRLILVLALLTSGCATAIQAAVPAIINQVTASPSPSPTPTPTP